jgi:predicted RNA-binding Zn ribbon-like protein
VNVAELTRFVEDKPAPEPLLALQAFANTLDVETGTDALSSPAGLRRWLVAGGLATRGVAVSSGDLRRARELRDTLRALLTANADGSADRHAAGRLRAHLGARSVPLTVDRAGTLELDLSPARSVEEFLSLMIGIAFQAQIEGLWARLKLCRNDECQWAFFDSSRNRGGSWCRMEVCGNRIKNRHYRRRHHKAG